MRQIHMWVLTLCHLKFTTQIKFGYVLFYCKFLDCISFYISIQPSFFWPSSACKLVKETSLKYKQIAVTLHNKSTYLSSIVFICVLCICFFFQALHIFVMPFSINFISPKPLRCASLVPAKLLSVSFFFL